MVIHRLKKRQIKHKKKFKKRRIILGILFIIFLVFLAGISRSIYISIKNSLWDGDSRLNLVLNINPISLVSFNPSDQKIIFLIIPQGTYIEATGNYGYYRIEKIFALGELEGNGIKFLCQSIQEYFGLPIDGWITASNVQLETEERKLLSSLIKQSIKRKSLTNLSRWDLFRLWWITSWIRRYRIEITNLGNTASLKEFDLPDGTKAQKIDEDRINLIIGHIFTDHKISQEGLKIAVTNAGRERGLAAKAAKLITNIGGQVIEISDWPEKIENCQIRVTKKGKKTYTAEKLRKIFNCQLMEELKETRWDLLLVLIPFRH